MRGNLRPSGKRQSALPKAGHQRQKRAYGTKKQAYVVSENGGKAAPLGGISDPHKRPKMHIGANPPTSDPPPPSPGKKSPIVPKVITVYIVKGKNTTKVIKRRIFFKGTRKLGQSYHIKDKFDSTRRKK